MVIKLIPPVATLEAKPPEANMMDKDFPSNLHFLKFLMLVYKPNIFYDMSGNKILIPQSDPLSAYLRYDSNRIYFFMIFSYIYWFDYFMDLNI